MKKVLTIIMLVLISLPLQQSVAVQAQEVVDTIVAVVGDEIILLSELQKQLNSQMMAKGLDLNSPRETLLGLRDEVLDGMIDDRLLLMKAQRDSIEIDMREVDRELKNSIAALKQRYSSEEAFQKGLDEYGLTEVQLRNMYTDAIAKNFLIDRIRMDMSRHISVTPQDMESWIAANRDSLPQMPEKYKLSHILIYPDVGEERKNEAIEKLEGIRKRIMEGEDFAELAKQFSQDPGTSTNGGYIDYFTRDSGYDPAFTHAAFGLQKGEVSGVVETVYGYHLIKCEDIRGDEIAARHILIRLAPDESDEKRVIEQLQQIREDILSGKVTFDEMAKKYSHDENSKDLGGKLDWISSDRGMSDSGIPSFIINARELNKGEISEPFKSQFGYHIIRLDDSQEPHTLNMRDDRAILENLIRQKKFLDEYERIIAELRKETFVDVRLN